MNALAILDNFSSILLQDNNILQVDKLFDNFVWVFITFIQTTFILLMYVKLRKLNLNLSIEVEKKVQIHEDAKILEQKLTKKLSEEFEKKIQKIQQEAEVLQEQSKIRKMLIGFQNKVAQLIKLDSTAEELFLIDDIHKNETFAIAKARLLLLSLNPHILGNLRTVITFMASTSKLSSSEKIGFFDNDFHPYFDHIRELQKKNFITLKEEINALKLYSKIVRHFRNIEIDISLENVEDTLVPPLILQPLFENTIQWAFTEPLSKNNKVSILASLLGNNITITYSDNGRGIDKEKPQGDGITIVQERLKMYNEFLGERLYSEPIISNNADDFGIFDTGTRIVLIVRKFSAEYAITT